MIEFVLGLVALVVFGFGAMWLYAAVYDFVDYWKTKRTAERIVKIFRFPPLPPIMDLEEARLPPMARMDEEEEIIRLTEPGRYGMDHEPPTGPPDNWEKRPRASKTAPWA